MTDWDYRFLQMAKLVASWSKDLTKVGAVIVRGDKTVASVGYNGFARGMDDSQQLYLDRETKYSRIIHSEMNAILHAREPLNGYTLYTWPFLTCERCAVHVIQAGIKCVKAPACPEKYAERWAASFAKAKAFYREAHVQVEELCD